MINELRLQLTRFIESCDNDLLKNEAMELLISRNWWSAALKNADQSFFMTRTEKIFMDYVQASAQ